MSQPAPRFALPRAVRLARAERVKLTEMLLEYEAQEEGATHHDAFSAVSIIIPPMAWERIGEVGCIYE